MKVNDSIEMYLGCVLILQLASSRFFYINAETSGIDSCLSYDVGDPEEYAEGLNFPSASEPSDLEQETIVADLPFGRLPNDWKRLSHLGDVLPVDVEFKKKFVAAYKILIIAHQLSLKRGSEEFAPIVDVDIESSDFETIGRRETARTGSWGSEESVSTDKQDIARALTNNITKKLGTKSETDELFTNESNNKFFPRIKQYTQTHDETWHIATTRFEDQFDAVSQYASIAVASTPFESIESNKESGQNLLSTNIVSLVSSEVETTTGSSNVEWSYNQPSTTTDQKYTETPSVSSPSSLENTINSVDPEAQNSTLEFFTSTRTSIASPVEDVESSSVDDLHVSTAEQSSLSITEGTRPESATINPHHYYYYTSSTQQSSPSSTKFSAVSSSPFTNTDFHEEYEEVTADRASGRVGISTDTFRTTSTGEMLFPKVSSRLVKATTGYLHREDYASRNLTATPFKNVHEFPLQNRVTREDYGETEKTMFENNFENSGSETVFGHEEASTLMSRERYTTKSGAFRSAGGPSNNLATYDSAITEMITDVSVSLKPTGQPAMTSDSLDTSQRKEDDESVSTSGIPRDIIWSGGITSRKLYTISFKSFTTTRDAEEDPVYEENAPTSGFINANGSLPRPSTVVIKDKTTIMSQGMVEHGVDGGISENSTPSMENGTTTRERLFEVTTPLARDESRDTARSNNTSSFVTFSQPVFTDSSTSSVKDQLTSLQQQTIDLSLAVSVRASTLVGYHDVDDGKNTPTTEQTVSKLESHEAWRVVEDTTNVSSYPLTNDSIATTDTDSSIVRLQTTTILDPFGPTIHTPWKVDAGTSSPASKIVTTYSSIDSTKLDANTESREVLNGLTTFSRPHLTNTVSDVTAEENHTLWTTAAWKILMESTTKLPFVVTTSSSKSNTNDDTSDKTWIQRTSFSAESGNLDDDLENGAENISNNRHSTIPVTTIDVNNSVRTDSTDFQIVEGIANFPSLKTNALSEPPPARWRTPKITSVTEFVTAYRSSQPTPSSSDPKMRNPVENIPGKKIVTFNINEDIRGQTEILEHHSVMAIGSDGGHSTASTPAIGHVSKIHSRNKWNSFGDECSSSIHKTSNNLEIPQKTRDNVFEYETERYDATLRNENSNRPIFVPLHVIPKSKNNFRLDSNRLPSEWSLQKRAKSNMDVEKLYRWFYRHSEDLGDSHRRGSGTDSKTADIRCNN